ncbi:UNVERIFIED_CONTAM: hypothetical protein RMT77_011270 [Armadillidium vulgare]
MIILALFTIVNLINYSTPTFVDLGHELRYDVPIYPLPGYLNNRFTLTAVANETTPKGFWIAYSKFCSVEHVSTHVDAPYHFYETGWTVDEIPLSHLIAPGVVIDVSAKAAEIENYLISAEDVDSWVSENGVFPNNSLIIGRTGWSKKFQDPVAYLGDVTDMTKLVFPGFGADSIRRILSFKTSDKIHVVGFGIDTMSLDHGPSQEYESHQIVQGENLYIIENMNNLEALPLTGSKIFVMPMKIVGGTGAPTRVIAELPSTEEVSTEEVSTEEVTTSVPPIDESSSILDTTETISVESSSPTHDESAVSSSSVPTSDSSTTSTTAPEASSPDEVL